MLDNAGNDVLAGAAHRVVTIAIFVVNAFVKSVDCIGVMRAEKASHLGAIISIEADSVGHAIRLSRGNGYVHEVAGMDLPSGKSRQPATFVQRFVPGF